MTNPVLPPRFHAFTATQALGAFNDNVFRTLLQLFVIGVLIDVDSAEALSKATFVFTIPFVLFGPWSGYLSDRFAKHNLMRVIKIFEILIMLLGALAFYIGHLNLLLVILFLMATQSAFFSPAKQGIIPEMCKAESITHANGWVEMTTFVFIILGIVTAGGLMTLHDNQGMLAASYCVAFAVAGSTCAFFIPKMPAAGSKTAFPWNPLVGIAKDLKFLKAQQGLWLAGLANSYFWMIGMLYSTNVLIYGDTLLGLGPEDNIKLAVLPAFMAIGIGTGSMLASRLSAQKVEIGLVPLGGFGIAAGSVGLFFSTGSYLATSICLIFTGVAAGLYIVPLFSYLQFRADEQEKGRVLATVGILNGLFLVLGSIIFYLLSVELSLKANTVFLVIGLATVVEVIYICTVIPEYFLRMCNWLITHTFYNISVRGDHNVPFRGPALIVPNHVTFIDAFLISSTVQRLIRYIMLKDYYDVPIIRSLFGIMDVIPIAPSEGRESVVQTLITARQKLLDGHVVCIFAEGALTRDGQIQEFRTGLETIMEDVDCPIVPACIHDVWGSIFSWQHGKAIWKWPKKIPYPVTITFGEAMPPTATANEVEQAVRGIAADFESSAS
ncbi:MAG: MFS transporter [Pseudomonadales bacterium]|jgi:acyl-[acyl-carrier-protein]-phospholipid O-acyltransferase/long-chain-fatty-acid--[acyl-carrier-protein] ligase|nr:MFS transporter [Pseudomonadales bacterium]MDP7358719.1 MFS transporter [Pseudomonadales bacterium]MDP7597449.1 MFS transporter [Pseudomonadales bacterium]HJN49239.1 MFS transporter [Pseudomonadales bacterium]|tara:strand:+ start:190 stop:2016 length:1827 start_codon:yes stop_codon:yes gene_type:complete